MRKRIYIIIAFMLLLTVLSACGSKLGGGGSESNDVTTNDATPDPFAAESQKSADPTPVSSAGGTQESANPTPVPSAVESTAIADLATPDPKSGVDLLLGSWIDVDAPDRFANITKTTEGYAFEDNEGTYKAVFADGQLKVLVSKVTEEDYVIVYYDEKLKNMVYVYEGALSKFRKK